ncbi:MAG: hypothetical protein B0W54_12290 [Cellvibrio sp. 79]|nr:MAG: hypothetical protein B0W54_12290 [Cellvibrio sp. 79]
MMTDESPLRAQPDSRILDQDSQQGYLFDGLDEQKDDQLLSDYRQRYGLSEDPFAHDYSFPLFTGAGRRQLLDQLLHLCQFSNSVLVVLGENGVGKTRVAHAFMDSLSDHDQICFISVRAGQTLEQILLSANQAFEIPANDIPSTESLLAGLEAFIAEEALSEDDGLAVVVLDNAHLLDDQSISVLTSLLNNFPQQNRLHLALFGEPPLMRRLERLSPESLLCNDFYLQAFTLPEAVDYLNFRMEMADYLGPEIFSESKVDSWWSQAQGQLNVLHGLAEEHLLESVTPARTLSKRPLPVVHIVAISLLIAVVGVAFLYMGDDEQAQPPAVAVKPAPASAAPTVASSSIELASTQTPVQPLMQSLPQPQQPNQQVQQASTQQAQVADTSPPAVQETPPVAQPTTSEPAVEPVTSEIAKEEVVPLAQLPTAPPKPAGQIQSVPASNPTKPAQEVAAPSAKVASTAAPASAVAKPEPVSAKPASKPAQQTSGSTQERNILSWKPSEYTIQLVGVSNQKAALDFIAAQPNKSELLMFKSKRAGKDWFVVITGRFANSAQARQAIKTLPAAQRDAGPWPRDAKTIQSEIKTAM